MLPCFVFPPNLRNSFVLRRLGLMGVGEGHLRYEDLSEKQTQTETVPKQVRRHLTIEVPDGVTTSYEEVPNATALRRSRAQ
jgi:hypothetical protein